MSENNKNKHLCTVLFVCALCASTASFMTYALTAEAAHPFLIFGKKKKPASAPAESKYKQLTGRDSVRMAGLINAIHKGESYYLEIPVSLIGRQLLVNNKLQRVPKELNEAGVNRGINYQNVVIRLEWDKDTNRLLFREQRLTPEVPSGDAMAASVADNYIDPLIAAVKIEAVAPDSSTVMVKADDLFNGRKSCLNDVFNLINIGTSPTPELSRIVSMRSFGGSLVATSELSTTVHEGNSTAYITVVVSTSLMPLPEHPMRRRKEDWRVGYFTTQRLQFSDQQEAARKTNYITRWRLVPSDTTAYMRGKLTEPVTPITFYIDPAVPAKLRPWLKKGITDWNKAFERAGFKNAVRALDFPDSLKREGDDMKYSVLTYDASEKANAMGPSVIDPRTGEILEADIIWWHNVQSLIREWLMVQTAATDPRTRTLNIPDSIVGDAARFVVCHEVGHSLGLRHNMIASAAYPTDSLRSEAFTSRVGGTAASIMDYARFNYVAQPGDGVSTFSPHLGPYDMMAIEWGYRWYPPQADEPKELAVFLSRHKGKEYRYSEAQPQRTAIDPRALSEDLGDDAMKSAAYGIANLKRLVPHIIDYTRTGDPGQGFDEASRYYGQIVYQWGLYLYHVLANVGGMYLNRPELGTQEPAYTFVEKERQKRAVRFLLDEVLTYPKWLFDNEISRQIYIQRTTLKGVTEEEPNYMLKNEQNYILWDLLDNERLIRMSENEAANGAKAFTPVELIDMLHRHIFAATLAGRTPDVMQRSLQKSFVDALITAANESESIKINKKLIDRHGTPSLDSGQRTIDMGGSQVIRNSDAISVKRGELLRVRTLLKARRNGASLAAQMHYDDLVLRINTALGLNR